MSEIKGGQGGSATDDLARKLRIGCSGWSYDDWVGSFYPSDAERSSFLKLYTSVFDAVEVDSSFYRVPPPNVVSTWRKQTPEDFRFTAKFPRKITHDSKLVEVTSYLNWFYRSVGELKEKLAGLLIQLPPSLKSKEADRLESFLAQLSPSFRHFVEFRHKSWFNENTMRLLEQYKVGFCWSYNQYLSTPPEVTSDILYVRLVGDRSISRFKEIQLDQSELMKTWLNNLREKSELFAQGYVFFNNHFAGFGPGSVNEFRRLLGLIEVSYPLASLQSQRTLTSFR